MNLSFFARTPYPNSRDHHLVGGSSVIRAMQIAEYLGAKINPAGGYENDICIYIKQPEDGIQDNNSKKGTYLDIIDDGLYVRWLRRHPKWKGIAVSQYIYDLLKIEMPGRIVHIPQQHCNFENFRRRRRKIVNVGIVGLRGTFQYPIDDIRQRLERIGMRLITNFDFQTREDVVNFYKTIDIQIIWRISRSSFINPLKIINAASFGIPTVGYPQKGYKEVEGYYVKVGTIDQLINEVEKLKNPKNYKEASKNLLKMAKKYHISKIAKLYKKLA